MSQGIQLSAQGKLLVDQDADILPYAGKQPPNMMPSDKPCG